MSISNTNVEVWVNVVHTHSIVITHCAHQQNNTFIIFLNMLILHYLHPKTHFLVVKMNSLVILESKTFTITPCYITNIHKKEVFTMITTTSRWQIPSWKGYGMCITLIYHNKKSLCPINMWNSMQYERACSLTLNYYTLIVWTNMVCYELGG